MSKSIILFNPNSLESFAVAFLEKEKLSDWELVGDNLFNFVHQVKIGKVSVSPGDCVNIVSPMRKTTRVKEQYQCLEDKGIITQDLSTIKILDEASLKVTSPGWILFKLATQSYSDLFDERIYSPDLIRNFAQLETMNQILQIFGYKVLDQALTPGFKLAMYFEGAKYQYQQVSQIKYPIRYFREKTSNQSAVLLNEKYPYASLGEVIINSFNTGKPQVLLSPVASGKNLIIFVSYFAGSTKIKANSLPEGIQYIVREGNNDYMVLPDVTVPEVVTAILE